MKKAIIYDVLIFALVLILLVFVTIPYVNVLLPFLVVMIYSYKHGGFKLSLGLASQKKVFILVVMALALAIALVFISYFVLLDPIEKLTHSNLKLGTFSQLTGNFNLYVSSIIIGWVIGGFFEEIIFRGFMISKFMKHFGKTTGAIIGIVFSSIIFGSLHSYQGISGQILTGLVGLFLALIYVISKRNLWLNILTHGLVNSIIFTLLYSGLIK